MNARDFSALADYDAGLWPKLLGADVDHAVYGRGKVLRVEIRPNYTPLITLSFEGSTKTWPPKTFESGNTTFYLQPELAALVDQVATELTDRKRAEAEAENR